MSQTMTERIAALKACAATRPHGTRARYRAGCKCLPCRSANSRYCTDRYAAREAGDRRDLVDAKAARRHLKKLSKLGIGYKSVAAAASVAVSVVAKIRTGKRTKIRAHTERRILAVDRAAAADGALIPAASTWRMLDELLERGYTRVQLARWLGSKAKMPSLQLKKDFVTARNAMRVERMHEAVKAGKLRRA